MRNAEERSFITHDGRELFYRHWPNVADERGGAIVLFHRGHEHSGRMAHLVDELDLPEFAFFAWDARGHGRSARQGTADTAHAMVRDVDSFIAHIGSSFDIAMEDIAVVGQSVGAVLLAAWIHDYAPRIRAMVLASPAFSIKLYVPFARPALRLAHVLKGNFLVKSYVKGRFLTHDDRRAESYETDPLIVRPISVRLLLDLDSLARRIVADAGAIFAPTQLLLSGADWVVRSAPQHEFYERLGAAVKERVVLDGFYHDTLGEKDRARALARVRSFLLGRFAKRARYPSLGEADRHGMTRREADRLARPLSPCSAQGIRWIVVRLGLRVGAWFSQGLRIGQQTGFDSGSSLDYVYRNKATGLPLVGKAIDRLYLDAVGWKGIRHRKAHVEALLRDAAERLRAEGRPVHLTDIAAGHGRYVLDAVNGMTERPESVLLRDYCDINVRSGRELIVEKGLADVARFCKGDAFDADALGAIEPRPTIAVVSGLYELFSSNEMVRRSLEGIFSAVEEGGFLVYTGQPWHPQLELIGRALTSHRAGRPWIMRRRAQAELDELVAAAGFTKIDQRIDEWGIFSVSLAQKAVTRSRRYAMVAGAGGATVRLCGAIGAERSA